MTEVTTRAATPAAEHGGFEAPPFRRLRYFHGQLLTARDFQREQEYFREKLKLRVRCLLGYGVVCGLFVEPVAPEDCDDHDDEGGPPNRHAALVRITPGLGVDCDGNEVVVRGGCAIDLWAALPADERTDEPATVWIGVEYAERPVEPTRTVFTSACGDTSDCESGYTEECYRVRVTTHEPPEDRRCETCCCSSCEHKTLWLARIDEVDFAQPVPAERIHLNIRRPFGPFVPTVITGINWVHGHTYTVDEAKELLGTQKDTGGLVVRFSDDVRVDTLRPGVVDIQVIEGGAGRNADTWYMGGAFEEPTGGGEFTTHFRYRQTTRETLQDGDRVLITVRSAFILDRCCRPVDGTNVGGKVPYVTCAEGDHPEPEPVGCLLPPSGIGPWTSGTGAGGGTFESWFYITEERR
ncbi:hypothetical protein V5P93_003481 [Actinokineospora auranticolor]|uniref:SH2 domain-containing protein n=1 Tax=Actinokineospora auranticolor TaxID=155976 RepID=A0A2S6GPJ0_9PSEU|nr:hypothetical protein [Actinokineospora auranticolor]PPK67144.1 hypothetical protein CLV40_108141 [Actinokineospora auranticolor]